MNGEDCRVLLERSSRPLRPTRPARSAVRARSLARLLARTLTRPESGGSTGSRGEPVRRHDEWSAHYGEVPATKSRDEMSPFACERRASTLSRVGTAARGEGHPRDSPMWSSMSPPTKIAYSYVSYPLGLRYWQRIVMGRIYER